MTLTAVSSSQSKKQKNEQGDILQNTLDEKFIFLRFPPDLEQRYRATFDADTIALVVKLLPITPIPVIMAIAVMYFGVTPEGFTTWLHYTAWPVIAALVWLAISRITGLLVRMPQMSVFIAITTVLFAGANTAFLLADTTDARIVSYQVVYFVFIMFSATQMQLPHAIGCMALVCVAVLVSIIASGNPINWMLYLHMLGMPTIIGTILSYTVEHRSREQWLRQEIALQAQRDLQHLKHAADEESYRQRLLGEYLAMVSGNPSITGIANASLRFLIEHTGAQVGAIYLLHDDQLRCTASWALAGEVGAQATLGRRDTLLGQALTNGRPLHLTHVPEDYLQIRSATGSAPARELLAQPVTQQEKPLAVIELASLQTFNATSLALVRQVADAMASSLAAAQSRDALARAGMAQFEI